MHLRFCLFASPLSSPRPPMHECVPRLEPHA
jgi:hypothetical protein